MNHSAFCDIVNEEEEECLRYLKNLDLIESEDIKSGCEIIFTFYPNRFFENETITKEFDMQDWEAKVKTSEIKWKISRPDSKKDHSRNFFNWLEGRWNDDDILDVLREDIFPNPVYHFSVCLLKEFRSKFHVNILIFRLVKALRRNRAVNLIIPQSKKNKKVNLYLSMMKIQKNEKHQFMNKTYSTGIVNNNNQC